MDKIVSEEIFSNRLKGVCHPLYIDNSGNVVGTYDEIHQEVCVKMNSPFGVYNAPEHELLFRNSLYLLEISELFGILRAEHPLY
jgi:hypothetical protein